MISVMSYKISPPCTFRANNLISSKLFCSNPRIIYGCTAGLSNAVNFFANGAVKFCRLIRNFRSMIVNLCNHTKYSPDSNVNFYSSIRHILNKLVNIYKAYPAIKTRIVIFYKPILNVLRRIVIFYNPHQLNLMSPTYLLKALVRRTSGSSHISI